MQRSPYTQEELYDCILFSSAISFHIRILNVNGSFVETDPLRYETSYCTPSVATVPKDSC